MVQRYIYDYNVLDENGEKGDYVLNPEYPVYAEKVRAFEYEVFHPTVKITDFSAIDSIAISIKNGSSIDEAVNIASIIDAFEED